MAGKGGGAWKVAYADFVTAMMAFFMVMWLVSQSAKVKEAVAESFRDPKEKMLLMRKPLRNDEQSRGRYRVRSNNPLASEDPNDPPYDRPRLQTVRESDRTTIGSIVPFEEESAELDKEGREKLDLLLPLIVGKPQKLEIRGHSSRRPLNDNSPYKDAWELSYARCVAVKLYLEENGISANRMRMSQAAGFEPITTKTDGKQQSKNPRVEVFLINEWVEDLVGTRSERSAKYKVQNE